MARGGDEVPEDVDGRGFAIGAGSEQSPGGDVPLVGGRYALLEKAGEGAMGAVWRAVDRRVDRVVALKRIRPGVLGTETEERRFLEEALVLERLHHDGVVRLLDAGRDEEGPFLVMEWVRGESLEAVLGRERPDLDTALRWAGEICGALAAVHGAGVLHRDVKAANVLVDETGAVKVSDFGLARRDDRVVSLTAEGMLLGTPPYMAPEVIEGRETTAAADVYAAGVLFWELFAGRRPFREREISALFDAHLHRRAPGLGELRPDLPPSLVELVDRCLAKAPAARWSDFASMEARFRAIRGGEALPPPRVGAGETVETVRASMDDASPGGPPPEATGTSPSAGTGVAAAGAAPRLDVSSPTRAYAAGKDPRRWRRLAMPLLVGALLLVPSVLFLRGRPETAIEIVDERVGPRSLRLELRTRPARSLAWELVRAGVAVGRGRSPEGETHRVTASGLRPGELYELRLRGGEAKESLVRAIRCPALLRRPPWVVRRARVLALHLDLADRADVALAVRVPGARPERREQRCEGACVMLVAGLPDGRAPWAWTLELDGRPVAEGRVDGRDDELPSPMAPFLPGGGGRPWEPCPFGQPVWFGDRLITADRFGALQVASPIREPGGQGAAAGEGPAPPSGRLRRCFAFRPPELGALAAERWCSTAWAVDEKAGTIHLASGTPGSALRLRRLDLGAREEAWRGRSAPDGVPGRWFLEPGGWNAPLGPLEWVAQDEQVQLPVASGLLDEGGAVFLAENRGDEPDRGELQLLRIDGETGRVRSRLRRPMAEGFLASPGWEVSSGLVRAGDRCAFVVAEDWPHGAGARRRRRAWIFSAPLRPGPGEGFVHAPPVEIIGRWQHLVPDDEGRLWLGVLGGFRVWDPRRPAALFPAPLTIPAFPGEGPVEGLVAPVTHGGTRHAVVNQYLDAVPPQAVGWVCRFGLEGAEDSVFSVERVMGSFGFRRHVWNGRAIGLVAGAGLSFYDFHERRMGKLFSARELARATARPDGMVALVWDDGTLTLSSLVASVASDRRRVSWR